MTALNEQLLQAMAAAARQELSTLGATRLRYAIRLTPTSRSGGVPQVDWVGGTSPFPPAPAGTRPWDNPEMEARMESADRVFDAADGASATITVDVQVEGPVEIAWFDNGGEFLVGSAIKTMKLGRKRRKGTPPPVVALTDRRADNDLAEIRDLLAARGHTQGFTDEQIAAAQTKRKVEFPEELRLLFSLVKKGVLVEEDEDDEGLYAEMVGGLTAGTGKLGNVVDVNKRWGGTGPVPTMPPASLDDVVQQVYAAPGWVVFADDGGGNAYALDLVPGPQGRIGQVVQFDHEQDLPPELVAWSLTDFLAGRLVDAPPIERGSAEGGEAKIVLGDYVEKHTLTPGEVASLEDLQVIRTSKPIDLEALRGASGLKKLELVEFPGYEDADYSALATLTGLEYLMAPVVAWQRIAETNAWPPALVLADVAPSDSDVHTPIDEAEAANLVLARYGQPVIQIHRQTFS